MVNQINANSGIPNRLRLASSRSSRRQSSSSSEFELELLLEFELEFELELLLELELELELEFELELLLEFELELLFEFELELLLEFELELLLEFELPPPSSSLLLANRLLRNWVLPPVSGGADRSTPEPIARLKKPNGPSSAAAGVAIALVDTNVAAMIFLKRIFVILALERRAAAAHQPSFACKLGPGRGVSKARGRFLPFSNLALAGFSISTGGKLSTRKRIGSGPSRSAGRAYQTPRHQRRIAFCTCSRFSASSKTTEFGPSITSLVTSSPRCAGRQCMKSAEGFAAAISAAFTW